MKNLSWKKWAKLLLRISSILAIVIVLFGGWSTQRQDSANSQLFLISRGWNGIGVLFLLVAWGFWEWFLTSKNGKMWKFITSYVLFFLAVLAINGILGLTVGFIMLAILLSIYLLDYFKTLSIGKEQ